MRRRRIFRTWRTTPGIDPQFSQILVAPTLNGKFLEVNLAFVAKLKELNLWEELKDDLLANQGDIQGMEQIPKEVRDVYKTCFQLSPYAFIEVAARKNGLIRAISRNMYLETRDIDEYMKIYSEAWKAENDVLSARQAAPSVRADHSSVEKC